MTISRFSTGYTREKQLWRAPTRQFAISKTAPRCAKQIRRRPATKSRPDAAAGRGPNGRRNSPRSEAEEFLLADRCAHRGDVFDRGGVDRSRHEPVYGREVRQHTRRGEYLRAAATTQHRNRQRVG